MSAYMVNEDTLDLLASVASWSRRGLFLHNGGDVLPPRSNIPFASAGESIYYDECNMKEIKEELRLENIASLNARYPNDGGDMVGASEPFRPIYDDQATFAQALGALACYEYQACETDSWRNSYAHALCVAIRRAICDLISNGEWDYQRPAGQARRVSLMDMVRE
ncbi:hypothetical protein EBR96_10355 [bacterium]|nr:hypothetical protein [bacterium]